ncbi:DinB family protein [Streptomyces sp. NBC_01340]|uniref:mycothiol transferase n=1 Tax=Streptomyces sp. NBC_01340 TaxID=2903830 RepID=UPI002E11D593|nr:DinB family protein [Streptomyces sp. NBC_01340]
MLVGFRTVRRATLELKCAGLEGDLARRSIEPSTLSLLGLLRRLADVERRWFRQALAAQDASPRFSSSAEPDADLLRERIDGAIGV